MKRTITQQEERAFRLVHHDFEGLTSKEAADKMGITQSRLNTLLRQVKRKAPQLFPILTPLQKTIYDMYYNDGFDRQTIARKLGCKIKKIDNIIQQLVKKGIHSQCLDKVPYEPWMDNKIVEKF